MSFNIPILFVIFNRPDTERLVFEEIRKLKPRQLFVTADGPRLHKEGEKEKCEEARRIIDEVDWDCEVYKNFSDVNLGCGKGVSSGITWFFEHVEMGIILEDDCLPDQSFFPFCAELLERYKDNEQIMMISGDNFLPERLQPKESYYFSRIPHIWGWATWKRAWQKYDFHISDFPEFVKNKSIEKIWEKRKAQKYWIERFEEMYVHKNDTWDYQWAYCIWKYAGVSISPRINLVINVGFGGGTHTFNKNDRLSFLKRNNIDFPLLHLNAVVCNTFIDAQDINENFLKFFYLNYYSRKILKTIGLYSFVRYFYRFFRKLF